MLLFLLAFVWFSQLEKRIDEILTHDLDKIANDAARAIRDEIESSGGHIVDRGSSEKKNN